MTKQYLFVNENIFTFNSGTEFSAMNRAKLFKKNGINAKIVTRNYNPSLHQEIEKYGIDDDQVLNMYDYFQNHTDKKTHHEYLRYSPLVDKHDYKINGVDNNSSYIERLGQRIAKVSIFPLTVGEIGNIDYYDNFGNVASQDIFDYRGFKSKEVYMHPAGGIGHELVFDKNGNVVIEITHMNVGDHVLPSMYKLLNYKGKTYRFNTEDDLFAFFLEEISDKNTVIINDRPSLTTVVAKLNTDAPKYQYLHNVHTENATEANNPNAILFNNLYPLFDEFFGKFAGIIVPTDKQRKDLEKRYPMGKFYNIFDSAFDLMDNIKPVSNHNITYMGRVFRDKNISELLTIIPAIQQQIPDVHLNIMGYFESADYKNELDAIIKQLKIENAVSLLDYKVNPDKDKILRDTRVLVQTSMGEGLSMSLVEGLSYGIPEVAYDVNYGPNEIIENNVNGFLIEPKDIASLAKQVIELLNNQDTYERMHDQSITKSIKFNPDNVFEQWKTFINK
ncbi:accessory Sec system glycosyltransferase Asp1 [Apilactobacillus apinorum]|uniref:glycosyltransferase n=1 Tax=Apilactobacillus apinorum TaxID=1218495 RepID=UPI0030E9DA99